MKKIPIACGDCGVELDFDADPALAVVCPECRAPVGSRCRKPSGHRMPHGTVHALRDVSALEAGAYGRHRQEGRCTVSHEEAVRRARARVGLPDESRIPPRRRLPARA